MKYSLTLILLIFGLVLSCSAEDDGSSNNPTQASSSPQSTTPDVPDPGKPALSSPTDNEVCQEGELVDAERSRVNFSWNAAPNTDSYDLRVINLGTNEIIDIGGITTTSNELTLFHDVSYRWYVTAKSDGTAATNQSEVWHFYLAGDGQENQVPFSAVPLYPSPGATVDASSGTLELQWEGSDPDTQQALTYNVYLDTQFENIHNLTLAANEDFINLEEGRLEVEVLNGTTYFWRIETSDGISSSFTQVFSFYVN